MRGIPGSGKSTTATFLAGEHGKVHSTDSYFMEGGKYVFDPKKLKENHEKNFEAFCKDIENGEKLVVCDNTNTCKWEFEKYLQFAQDNGYITSIVELPHPPVEKAIERNSHGVPREAIDRMLARWEPNQ